MFNWIGLGLGAALIVAVFFAGDYWGPHAIRLAQIEAASKVRNAELARLKRKDKAVEVAENAQFAAADKELSAQELGQCVVTLDQEHAFALHAVQLGN